MNNLPMMDKDKANHAVYGSYIVAVFIIAVTAIQALLGYFSGAMVLLPLVLSTLMLVILAYAKERYSLNTGVGEYSMRDFWATIFGGLPVLTTYLVTIVTFKVF